MDKTLTEKKAKAVEMLIQGVPVVQIAEELGVHRNTIYSWSREDKKFKQAKAEAENRLLDSIYFIVLNEVEDILLNAPDGDYRKLQLLQQVLKMKSSQQNKTVDLNVKSTMSVDEMIASLK